MAERSREERTQSALSEAVARAERAEEERDESFAAEERAGEVYNLVVAAQHKAIARAESAESRLREATEALRQTAGELTYARQEIGRLMKLIEEGIE